MFCIKILLTETIIMQRIFLSYQMKNTSIKIDLSYSDSGAGAEKGISKMSLRICMNSGCVIHNYLHLSKIQQ
jgi:hypothetical protein